LFSMRARNSARLGALCVHNAVTFVRLVRLPTPMLSDCLMCLWMQTNQDAPLLLPKMNQRRSVANQNGPKPVLPTIKQTSRIYRVEAETITGEYRAQRLQDLTNPLDGYYQ
jgi:hypothetical protein